jgi:hypothetical protein
MATLLSVADCQVNTITPHYEHQPLDAHDLPPAAAPHHLRATHARGGHPYRASHRAAAVPAPAV